MLNYPHNFFVYPCNSKGLQNPIDWELYCWEINWFLRCIRIIVRQRTIIGKMVFQQYRSTWITGDDVFDWFSLFGYQYPMPLLKQIGQVSKKSTWKSVNLSQSLREREECNHKDWLRLIKPIKEYNLKRQGKLSFGYLM